MAVLPDAERREVWADLMRRFSDERQAVSITKQDLRAAIDAIDAFFDANAATINAALPQPARSQLTTVQKALLLMFVITRRYLAGV
jgi:hypothetical protein